MTASSCSNDCRQIPLKQAAMYSAKRAVRDMDQERLWKKDYGAVRRLGTVTSRLGLLLLLLLSGGSLVKLGRKILAGSLVKGLLQEATGLAAGGAGELPPVVL